MVGLTPVTPVSEAAQPEMQRTNAALGLQDLICSLSCREAVLQYFWQQGLLRVCRSGTARH